MTADPYMARKQRGILDDTGHADVPIEAFGPFRDYDFDFDDCSMIGDWWAEPESTPIYDALVLADLASQAPRPSLWTRTRFPAWGYALLTVIVLVVMVTSPWTVG